MIKKIYHMLRQKRYTFGTNTECHGVNFFQGRQRKIFTREQGKVKLDGLVTLHQNTKIIAKKQGNILLKEYVKLMENTYLEALGGENRNWCSYLSWTQLYDCKFR